METNQCHRLLNSKAKFNRTAQPDWGRVASELDKQVTQVSRHSVLCEQSTKAAGAGCSQVGAAPILVRSKFSRVEAPSSTSV